MIVLHEGVADYRTSKPVLCPKCGRGRIGSIPVWSKAQVSRRGKPPPEKCGEGLLVKCTVCNSYWLIKTE